MYKVVCLYVLGKSQSMLPTYRSSRAIIGGKNAHKTFSNHIDTNHRSVHARPATPNPNPQTAQSTNSCQYPEYVPAPAISRRSFLLPSQHIYMIMHGVPAVCMDFRMPLVATVSILSKHARNASQQARNVYGKVWVPKPNAT